MELKRYQKQPATLGDIKYLLWCQRASSPFVREEATKILTSHPVFSVEDEATRPYKSEYDNDAQRHITVKIVGGHYEIMGDSFDGQGGIVTYDERETLESEEEARLAEEEDWRKEHLACYWRSTDGKHYIEVWVYEDGIELRVDGHSSLGPKLAITDLTEEERMDHPGIVAKIRNVGLTAERLVLVQQKVDELKGK